MWAVGCGQWHLGGNPGTLNRELPFLLYFCKKLESSRYWGIDIRMSTSVSIQAVTNIDNKVGSGVGIEVY